MNRIKSFLQGKGFYVALAVCVLAAIGSSFWAIRSVLSSMEKEQEYHMKQEEQTPWQMPQVPAEEKVNDLPKPSAEPSQPLPSQSGSAGARQPDTAQQESAALAEPSFVKPVDGEIAKPFSGDELVYNKTLGDWRTHDGVDIACAEGSEVKSARAGKVRAVYEDDMWGTVAEVESDGLVWRYTGLDKSSLSVKAGDEVHPGTPLAKIGTSCAEVGEQAHLHLEVSKDGVPVNPEQYFE